MRGSWAVARRCHLGIPMVIENHPFLDDGSPFPTLFWLTCPILVKRISRLEADGWMQELNALLESDPAVQQRFQEAIDDMIDRRDEHAVIERAVSVPGGGPDRVKCLHAHAAQELVMRNDPPGALALARTGWPDCRAACVGEAAT
jgi:uncharacterized protein